MKLLLVLGSNDNFDIISRSLKPLGFELICYHQVLKAINNIDEINPSAIIVSARDFPRHWKILVQFVRSERSVEVCPIVVLKSGKTFSTEETSKAYYLGVNGVVNDELDKPEELDRLQKILSSYMPVHEKRKDHRFIVEPWNHIGFLMVNAAGKSIITGEVKTLSSGGLSFRPDASMPQEGIPPHSEIRQCSLRIGDAILSPACSLIRSGKTLSLKFISFPKDQQRILDQYLEEFPLLEAKKAN